MSPHDELLPIARALETDGCCCAPPSRALCTACCPLCSTPAKGDSGWKMKCCRTTARPISSSRKVYTVKLGHHRGQPKPTMAAMLARAEHLMSLNNWYRLLTNNCEHCMFTGRSLSPLLNVAGRIPRGEQLPPLILQSSSAHQLHHATGDNAPPGLASLPLPPLQVFDTLRRTGGSQSKPTWCFAGARSSFARTPTGTGLPRCRVLDWSGNRLDVASGEERSAHQLGRWAVPGHHLRLCFLLLFLFSLFCCARS